MYALQFPSLRLTECADEAAVRRVVAWMAHREAENTLPLGQLWTAARTSGLSRLRVFGLESDGALVAAAVLDPGGALMMTWASPDMIVAMDEGLRAANCKITSVWGPNYVSGQFAAAWARQAGLTCASHQEQRIFQLARLKYTPPVTGHLAVAQPADSALVTPWFEGFAREMGHEDLRAALTMRDGMISRRELFIWKNPEPCAMAAWVGPTYHGSGINYVFVPEPLRGQGYGKAVVAALAQRMLGNGMRFCIFLTSVDDVRNNHLYTRLGGRPVSDLVQWVFRAPVPKPATVAPVWRGPQISIGGW